MTGPRRSAIGLGSVVLPIGLLLASSPVAAQSPPAYAADSILVRFRGAAVAHERATAHAVVGARVHRSFRIVDGLHEVKLPRGMRVKEAIELYRRNPAVLYAEPNWVVTTLATPGDPFFGQLWGLHNTGQLGGTPGADIEAPAAWDLTRGSHNVVVAVIDTGLDYTHQDLSGNMFRNAADCSGNGIDGDGNGHVNDCFGIDTANNDADPMDDRGHGTHVAGTIGALGNNGLGVVGVNWSVRLLPCKFLDHTGMGFTSDAIDCMDYVKLMKDRGVNIVATNNSWGGGGYSDALFDAIEAHLQRGILFIVSAGNFALDHDRVPSYPASYYLPNVISVAATTRTDGLAGFSDFGRRTVHLGAPGVEILSTVPGPGYGFASGTSMAAPHVSGVVALLAQEPTRDWRAIKNLVLAGGDSIPSLANTITGRRLNARGALGCSNSTVLSRLIPVENTVTGAIGTPINLAALHINCANPNGALTVTVGPGDASVALADDGNGADQVAGDGVYSGQWTPTSLGTHTLDFPDGSTVVVQVLGRYLVTAVPFTYRTITGTTLNLEGAESSASIVSPFPLRFGGGSFQSVVVSSDGHISFSGVLSSFPNEPIPTPRAGTLVAPWWDDLFPQVGTPRNVFWGVTGSAPSRELVIEWRDVPHSQCSASTSATVKFQLVLFEGSPDVLFNYADAAFGGACSFADRGGSASVGVQIGAGAGTQFSFNALAVTDSMSLRWTVVPGPTIRVSPDSRSFGDVPLGGSEDRTFFVQNVGGGLVTGSATAAGPFSIVSGGSYSLSMGQGQQVTVRFRPVATGTFFSGVAFSGGNGASRTVSGTGISVSPLAPVGLTATVVSASQVSLAWQDVNGNETQSPIERKSGASGTFTPIFTAGANVSAHADTGLSPATTYVYRVRACNATGCSGYSNEAAVTTFPAAFALTVTVRGSAAGTVTSAPVGISCGASCTAPFPSGAAVTLTAAPGAGARFRAWGGACSGSATTCVVTLNDLRAVTATFSRVFTDANAQDLLPAGTPIKAVHFTELLDAINAVQPGTNLSWIGPAPAVGGVVRAVHATTLRQAIGLGGVAPGSAIAAPHVNEIRLRIRALE